MFVEASLMSDYFVVLDPTATAGSFVAGFGEQSLAVSFAAFEREAGRSLVVLDGGTGEQIYPAGGDSTERPPRHSGMRFRGPATDADDAETK